MADAEYREQSDDQPHRRALAPFKEDWEVYRKMVDNNFLFHREVYARLHEVLWREIDRPFEFLDIACGDASASVAALKGTKVGKYDGIDLSQRALDLAASALQDLDCPFTLEHGDFVTALPGGRHAIDVAWIGLSLHHVLRPVKLKVMRSIRSIIAENGRLMIYEPTSPDGEDRQGWLRRYAAQQKHWIAYSQAEWDTMWAHTLSSDFPETVSVWKALGQEAGFGQVRELLVAPSNLLRMFCFSD
jgi:SAM-dependent methyltransferase